MAWPRTWCEPQCRCQNEVSEANFAQAINLATPRAPGIGSSCSRKSFDHKPGSRRSSTKQREVEATNAWQRLRDCSFDFCTRAPLCPPISATEAQQ